MKEKMNDMNKKDKSIKKKITAFSLLTSTLFLSACGPFGNPVGTVHEGISEPVKPIGNMNTTEVMEYANEGSTANVLSEFSTADGVCTVKVTEAFFDITLDEENATPFEAGKAYGEAINTIYPDYGASLEPYLFENIKGAFPNIEDDYTPVETRMQALFDSIEPQYQQEIQGLAEGMGISTRGIKPDGILSVEELMIAQMVPDCLRNTACSGLALWGDKTDTSDMIGVRCLEWALGSDNSMCKIQTVLRIKNKEKSITVFSFLGVMDVISGVNDNGVFAGMLDMYTDQRFVYEGKKCYSFAIRHALEEFETAKEVGEYLVSESPNFTFSHNVMITDGKEAYCAEDACGEAIQNGKAAAILRDCDTPLMEDLSWDSPDSLCIVNSYVTKGNYDFMSGVEVNVIRFAKYNQWVKEKDSFDVKDVKNMMTKEKTDVDLFGLPIVQNVHRDNLTQMIILDYHNGSVQVAFTGPEGVTDKPVFYETAELPRVSAK